MFRTFAIFLFCLFAAQSQAGVTFKDGKISSSTSDSKTEAGQGSAATSIGWKEFIPRKGKPDFDENKIVGCGRPQKSYKILFGGTPEDTICQIGVGEPYQETKRDIDFGKYDIHGTMRTKCADALINSPKDIYVPTPMKYASWCPYALSLIHI